MAVSLLRASMEGIAWRLAAIAPDDAVADLWNAPEAANTVGASAVGSSEACMLAGMAAKWRWRARRRAAGKPVDNPNMVCGPVHGSRHDAGAGGREHDHGRADA